MSTAGTRSALPMPLAGQLSGRRKEILTPEGIPLLFQVGLSGDRIMAFVIDLVLMGLILLGLSLVAAVVGGSAAALGTLLLASFVVRYGYFIYFEAKRRGQTPGKRRMGIRVVDRQGGPLTVKAVIARNLTREFEVFLPLIALLSPRLVAPGGQGTVQVIALGWLVVLLLFPLFSREHLRVGDLIAGTLVVRSPKARLLSDLTAARGRGAQGRERDESGAERGRTQGLSARREGGEPRHEFTSKQLGIYGIYELQVLEDLLRESSRSSWATRKAVASKIARKIGYREQIEDVDRFLEDFYAAQRSHLEKGLLFGRRRERKDH